MLGVLLISSVYRRDGRSYAEIYSFFVRGLDMKGDYVGLATHKARGAAIGVIEHVWLGLWG